VKTEQQTKALIDALEDAGYDPCAYSGRGMYGKECVCVKGDISGWEVAKALWYANDDNEIVDAPEPRQDQLGLGIVLYWPSYEWPKERE
jgi:hypothetical protein